MKVVGGNRIATRDEIYEWVRTNVRVGDDGCLLWAGASNERGTPILTWNRQYHRARRLLVESFGHTLFPHWIVTHTCDSPTCMNVEHLRWGTKRQLMVHIKRRESFRPRADRGIAIAQGLAKRNPKLPLAKRNEVEAMRAQGATLREIADRYDVSVQHVSDQLARWRRTFGFGWREAA